ncbi:MAG: hypothetical protein IPJ74_25375 [Saprospiraceae bacterium]|nr:hypothetical protein [Saprospiraceae bacterium]
MPALILGNCSFGAFETPDKFIGKKLNLVGDFISGNELAAIATKLSKGKTYKHKPILLVIMYLFARVWIPLRKHFEKWGNHLIPKKY